MSGFAHLHCHDQFSFLDGFGKIEDCIKRVQEMKFSAYAQTNHGGMWGTARAWKACLKAGIKFIPGIEFFLDSEDVDKTQRRIAWEHLTVLATNAEGYRNLLQLASIAGQRMHRNRPLLEYAPLFKHSEGLIVLSGCPSSKVVRLINEGDVDRARSILKLFKKGFGDRFYIEIQPNNTGPQKVANPVLLELAHELKIKPVATNDVHYPRKEDASTHEVMLCVQFGDRMANPERWKFTWDGFYMADGETLRRWFSDFHRSVQRSQVEKAIQTVSEIVDRCNVPQGVPNHYLLPTLTKTPKAEFERLCKDGFLLRRLDEKQNRQDYVQRLKTEVSLIVEQGLHPYFLIISDLMRWARARMLVGPGRGSSGGSLVCFCLGITDVDPLVHNTLFERFITEERSDLPDIDMDFPASHRDEVVTYLREKYGEQNVAGIATYIEFKGRLALRDVAKAFDVPSFEVNKVVPLIVNKSGGDARADMTIEDLVSESSEFRVFAQKHPKVVAVARRLEGITRQLGKHAAGVTITDKPCTTYFPTFLDDGHLMSQWDKDDLEIWKLLKMDILGLDMLDTLMATMKAIEVRHKKKIDIYALPLDDKRVLKEFNDGNTVGVFQFESKGISYWAKTIGVKTFRDIVDVNALYRPGTLRSGTIKQYNLRKHGLQKWTYAHPYLKPILDQTYGIPVYQEQLMLIFNKIANFPWRTADTVRKVVSKSQGLEQFDKYKDAFLKGCAKRGITEKVAHEMFVTMRDFGAYGFNLSHSVEYSMIGYWSMWMKVYYPQEYLGALASNENDPDQVGLYLKEAGRLGIEVQSPMVGKSGWGYRIEGKALRIGLKDIKGIGSKAGRALAALGPITTWKELFGKTEKRIVNARVLKALILAGATKDLRPHLTIKTLHSDDWKGFGLLRKGESFGPAFGEYPDNKLDELRQEVFPIRTGPHPLTLHKDLLERLAKLQNPVLPIEALKWTSGIYRFAGVITNIGYATIHRIIDGESKPKKLTYCTLDGEREYMVMMIRGGQGEMERVELVKSLNGKAVVVEVEVNADRNKVYLIKAKPLEGIK